MYGIKVFDICQILRPKLGFRYLSMFLLMTIQGFTARSSFSVVFILFLSLMILLTRLLNVFQEPLVVQVVLKLFKMLINPDTIESC